MNKTVKRQTLRDGDLVAWEGVNGTVTGQVQEVDGRLLVFIDATHAFLPDNINAASSLKIIKSTTHE